MLHRSSDIADTDQRIEMPEIAGHAAQLNISWYLVNTT